MNLRRRSLQHVSFVFLVVPFGVGCATAFQSTLSEGTEEAYREFLEGGEGTRDEDQVVRDSLARFVFQRDTEEAYRGFLEYAPRHEGATVRLQELLYEKALQSGLLTDWEAVSELGALQSRRLARWGVNLELFPDTSERYDMKYTNAWRAISVLEQHDEVFRNRKLTDAEDYLQKLGRVDFLGEAYQEARRHEVLVLMERYFLARARESKSPGRYQQYLWLYPSGDASGAIREALEELMYEVAVNKRLDIPHSYDFNLRGGKRELYDNYIDWFPNGPNAAEIRAGIQEMETKRATPAINSPQTASSSQESEFRFEWVTEISETSGYVSFEVYGVGSYIDAGGNRWLLTVSNSNGPSTQGRVRLDEEMIPSGGMRRIQRSAAFPRRGRTNPLCGGRAEFFWRGADTYGHKIEIKEVVSFVCD